MSDIVLPPALKESMMRGPSATWFCVDIECSGPVPGLYDMVSLGAVAVLDSPEGELRLGESFYMELIPQGPRLDERAMAIHGIPLEHLREHGMERRAGLLALSDWVKTTMTPGSSPVFVGHNAPFDWSFVSWCYAAEELSNPFGYKALDTKALSAGVLGLHWLETSKERLAPLLELPEEDHSKKHRADYDAAYQAEILIRLLQTQRGGRISKG